MTLTRRSLLAMMPATAFVPGAVLAGDAPLSVVATTGMLADTARRIGGAEVEVRALMGPGVDPHAYRQTRSDIVAMTRADLVVWNGLYLEAQMEDFMATLARRTRVTALAEAVPQDLLRGHDDYQNRFDPHVWMVPDLWAHVARAMTGELIALRPGSEAAFRANLEAFLGDLTRVGVYASDVLGRVPQASRVLLSAHDAFGYFGDAYGFEVQGIQGMSTESETGLFRIRQLVDLIVSRGVRAVFVESSVSDRNVRALIEGARAEGATVRIGGELFSDAMGEAGTYEGTLIGMLDHNATVIAAAFGVPVPERGMDGKLAVTTAKTEVAN